jgi:selenocysteine-specific elongation factor
MLKDTNKIFIASGGYVVDVNTLRKVINLLDGLGDITVGSVRDATGSSRKYILPLLELLDSLGITRRVQDKRILKRRDLP